MTIASNRKTNRPGQANNPWTVRYVSFPVLSFKPVLDAFDRVLAEWSRCVFFGIVCRELLAKDWAGLGWAGLGWARLGWAGLGWAGAPWPLTGCFLDSGLVELLARTSRLHVLWWRQPSHSACYAGWPGSLALYRREKAN